MKTIFSFLTIIGLLTFFFAGSPSAERLLYQRIYRWQRRSGNWLLPPSMFHRPIVNASPR